MNSRIKILKEKLNEDRFFKMVKKYNYYPRSFEDLKRIFKKKSKNKDVDLNDINVSNLDKVGEFSVVRFFRDVNFYVDEWNVSNVKDFTFCFFNCRKFNSDISNWDTSNGTEFGFFFSICLSFNSYLNNFDTSNGKYFPNFLGECQSFNQEVYNLKIKYNASGFFRNCHVFNQDISMWDVSKVSEMEEMFLNTKNFKQDLSEWDVSNVLKWNRIFKDSLMENYPELMPEKFRKFYIRR